MRRALFSLLFLAACAGGPKEPQPELAPARLADTEIIGVVKLHVSKWEPSTTPRAVILALHGYGDYGPSTYEGAAEYWAGRGFLTYAYDQRGFGRNESHGKWPGPASLVSDMKEVAALLHERHPDLPLFIIGHSMGGAVAMLGVADGVETEGLIFAAPAVQGGELMPLPYRAVALAGVIYDPDKRWTGEGIVSIQASDNIPMLVALGKDPDYLAPPSAREFMGLIRLMDMAVTAPPRISPPVLMLYGEKDQVAPKTAVMAAYEAIRAPKSLIFYDEGWHLLFRDLQREQVWNDIADWMESRS